MSRPTTCRQPGCSERIVWHEGLGWWVLAEGEYFQIDAAGPDVGYRKDERSAVHGWFLGQKTPKHGTQWCIAHRPHRHVGGMVGAEKGAGA